MILTTYLLEFQPPDGRTDDICETLKRKGRKHFDELKRRLPRNMMKESEPKPKPRDPEEARQSLARQEFDDLMLQTEWTSVGVMGRLLRPKLIPCDMTPHQEAALMKLYEETDCTASALAPASDEDDEEAQARILQERMDRALASVKSSDPHPRGAGRADMTTEEKCKLKC